MNSPKLIILEGPDGAGKSTLAKYLSEQYEGPVLHYHHGPYKGITNIAREFAKSMTCGKPENVIQKPILTILDRCWISEPIYASAFKRENRISEFEENTLSMIANLYGAVVIFCIPPFDSCKEVFLSRKDEEYLDNDNQLKSVWDSYTQKYKQYSNIPKLHFDYTNSDSLGNLLLDLESLSSKILPLNPVETLNKLTTIISKEVCQ